MATADWYEQSVEIKWLLGERIIITTTKMYTKISEIDPFDIEHKINLITTTPQHTSANYFVKIQLTVGIT